MDSYVLVYGGRPVAFVPAIKPGSSKLAMERHLVTMCEDLSKWTGRAIDFRISEYPQGHRRELPVPADWYDKVMRLERE